MEAPPRQNTTFECSSGRVNLLPAQGLSCSGKQATHNRQEHATWHWRPQTPVTSAISTNARARCKEGSLSATE
eukprot:8811251-Alexandrium_andersonii.AAC.1